MDKQLLEALNNIGKGLDLLVESLSKKEQSNNVTSNALKSGDFGKQLAEISTSIKSVKTDTQEILKKQDTILEMQKTKTSEKNKIEETGEDPKKQNSIKTGVTTILLIATAVLAIGLAFKMVGSIDFLSVIGLGLAIILISNAFVKVADAKLKVEDAIITGKVIVIMAVAITVSSWVLGMVRSISITQALSAILIAGVFSVASYGTAKLVDAFKGMTPEEALKASLVMPLVLIATSISIAISSWALSFIKPIGLGQAITAILIAGMFTVVSYGLSKLINSFKDITMADALKASLIMPVVLIATSMAISVSSWVLGLITPIGFDQALTAILIAAMFTVISFGMAKLLSAFKDITPGKAATASVMMPLLLIGISAAITGSSWLLSKVTPIKSFDQFITILGISLLFIVFALTLKIIAPAIENLKPASIIMIPVLFTALSVAIWASSSILANTEIIKYEDMFHILIFSVIFAIAAVVLGTAAYVLSKIGIDKIAEGGVAIVILAAVVMVSSLILSNGDYNENGYPSWKWALGVTTSILGFGLTAALLGTIVMSGAGAVAMLAGAAAILGVAAVIVLTSKILNKGDYTKYPSLGWAMGVGLSMVAFGGAIIGLGTLIVGTLGIGAIALAAGSSAVLGIADTIVATADILRKGNFTGGPTKEWAAGVGISIGAFAPVYGALLDAGIFGKSVSPEDMSDAIITISKGILMAGIIFSDPKNNGVFDISKIPSKEWGTNVGGALTSFAPVFDYMQKNSGWFSSGADAANEMVFGIKVVANAIISVAKRFASVPSGIWKSAPDNNWISNITRTVKGFSNLINYSKDATMSDVSTFNIITSNLVNTAKKLYMARNYFQPMDGSYIKNLSSNISDYMKLANSLTKMDKSGATGVSAIFGMDPVSKAADGMIKIAGAYDKLANALKKFSSSLQSIDGNKVNMIKRLTGNMAVLAAMNHDTFSEMMTTLEGKSNMFSKMLDVDNEKMKNRPSVGDKKVNTFDKTDTKQSKHGDVHKQLDLIIDLLTKLDNSAVTIAENTEDSITRKSDGVNA